MITLNFMVNEEIEENDVFNRNNSHDYSDNESSENNESSNEVPYYSSTNESSIKDHGWREDYNSKGEYKPVDEMTQEEIKKELEETLNDALGLE